MNDKMLLYETMTKELDALLENEHDMISNMSNTAAFLFHRLPDVSWVGFYLFQNNELILGPFQGNVACMHIPMGKGVCGTSATTRTVLRIDNVATFEGHIACDTSTQSEIVLPIIKEGTLLGVLDIDSNRIARFDGSDEIFLTMMVQSFVQSL